MVNENEQQIIREAERTAKGYFAIAFEQFPCWQGFFIDRKLSQRSLQAPDTTLNETAYMLLRMFLNSGVSSDAQGARTMVRNQLQIGVLGSLVRDYLGFDFFLVVGRIDGKTVTHSVETFIAGTVEEGRRLVMDAPLIVKIRNSLSA